MKRNKIFSRIIVVTLLITLLTFKVGRVVEVKAVGTTIAAAAGASLCALGIIYCSYMALSGASVHIPDTIENIESWLTDMGTKVVQFPSGRAAYEEIYPELIGIGDEPLTSMLDRAWTWTTDKLKSWANDFSSVEVNQNIASFTFDPSYYNNPTNSFDYGSNWVDLPETLSSNYGTYPFSWYTNLGFVITPLNGPYVVTWIGGYGPVSLPSNLEGDAFRNYYDGNYYYPQKLVDGVWVNISEYINVGYDVSGNKTRVNYPSSGYTYGERLLNRDTSPPFPNEGIYDATTDTWTPAEVLTGEVVNPQYPVLPPEDNNKPVIPYLKLPFDPNWIDPVTGLPGGGNWGFNLAQLLDALEDLAGLLMEIGTIGELINQFKNLLNGQSGDEYYIYYDDSEHNYYQYYTITNFGDNIYNYNINVSDADEHLPVDLNTIQTYTHNRYVDTIKESAEAGSSIIRDLVVFWYDVDPEIIYIFFGCSITILIAAFIGKWGHS